MIFDGPQYKTLSPVARAQVRLDWRHAYAGLVSTIRNMKLELKQTQRDKQPVCVLTLRLHAARVNVARLLLTRQAIKKVAGELRGVSHSRWHRSLAGSERYQDSAPLSQSKQAT